MRCACIDIGSNTTRLLVADCDGERLREIHQERSFTRIGRACDRFGRIAAEKLSEVAEVVAGQAARAREHGAGEPLVVATASVRRATNGGELRAAVESHCGLPVRILSEQEEARLAFIGAARRLGHVPAGELGVVDVGGGSTELAIGRPPDRIRWSVSIPIGSGGLAGEWLHSDPPARSELVQVRARVAEAFAGLEVPRPVEAIAVGGSATSLGRLVGPELDRVLLSALLDALLSAPARVCAERFELDPERVRLLPAGLVILEAVGERFAAPLRIGSGGLREGLLFEASGG